MYSSWLPGGTNVFTARCASSGVSPRFSAIESNDSWPPDGRALHDVSEMSARRTPARAIHRSPCRARMKLTCCLNIPILQPTVSSFCLLPSVHRPGAIAYDGCHTGQVLL